MPQLQARQTLSRGRPGRHARLAALDEIELYLQIGGRRDVIAASLVFIHGYSDDQAKAWIRSHDMPAS